MSDELYKKIADRYGFTVPDDYRYLESRGLFNINTPSHASEFYKPGSYLWLNEMEWLPPVEMVKFEFPSYCLPGFLPFAFTGGGDYWCWQVPDRNEGDSRVVLCHHDSEFATVYAPNFRTALFRQAIDFAREQSDSSDIDASAFLGRWAVDLEGIFPALWCEHLRHLAAATHRGILASNIEQTEISGPQLDTKVRWMSSTA